MRQTHERGYDTDSFPIHCRIFSVKQQYKTDYMKYAIVVSRHGVIDIMI